MYFLTRESTLQTITFFSHTTHNNSVMRVPISLRFSLFLSRSRVRKDNIYRGLHEKIYHRSNQAILHALGIRAPTEVGKTFSVWLKHRL